MFQCPCCDYFSLHLRNTYEICAVCYWEDSGHDVFSLDAHSGPNHMSLREGRRNFSEFGASQRAMLEHVLPIGERTKFVHVPRVIGADDLPMYQCPCCDHFCLYGRDGQEECIVCCWKDSGHDVDDPDAFSEPNGMTLRQGRNAVAQFGACDPAHVPYMLTAEERTEYVRVERRIAPDRGGAV